MMKFSVIIPLYNKAPHIRRTLESVLAQTHQDFEVIVVDDGSTDGGGEIVAEIHDQRIHLVRQENAGAAAARNKGIEEARFEYIAFLDADDEWLPHHLETMADLIKVYPECGMYLTSYIEISNRKMLKFKKPLRKPVGWHCKMNFDDYLDLVIKDNTFSTNTVCIPKSAFKYVGNFDLDISRGQDIDMWLRVAANFPVAFLNKKTAIYNLEQIKVPLRKKHKNNIIGAGLNRHAKMVKDNSLNIKTQEKLYEYYAKRMINFGQKSILQGHKDIARYTIIESGQTKCFRFGLLKLVILYVLSFLPTKKHIISYIFNIQKLK